MTTLRECADTAAAALAEMLRGAKGEVDTAAVAEVIENVLNQATSETEEGEGLRRAGPLLQGAGALRPARRDRNGDPRGAGEGFKFHLNLQKRKKAEAIHILEGILARLKA